jgi:hypothetical protein
VGRQSAGRGRVALFDQPMEGGFELRVVLIGVSPDEADDLPITLGGLCVIAPRLVDHSQLIIAIVYVGEAHEQIASGELRLVDLGGADQIDDGIAARAK